MAIATKKRPSAHKPKKVTGGHHNHGKRYLKTYWPYLPLLGIVLFGFVLNGIWSGSMHGVQGYATSISPASLLSDTNTERTDKGLGKLSINSDLAAAAQAKANDMVKRNYWSHVTPDGVQPWQFDTNAGYQYQSAGENLAYGFGSSAQVMRAWMASTEHRDNILNKNYQNVGFGIANSPNFQGNGPATIVVAEYGQPLSSAVVTSAPSETQVLGTTAASEPVSRVQLLSSASYAVFVVALIAGLAGAIFILRHGLALKKLAFEGEQFVLHHRYFDVIIVMLIVGGVLLTRTAGFIH